MSEHSVTAGRCKNCDTPLEGPYCHACGQPDVASIRFIGTLLNELLDDVFSFKSRASRTLTALFFHPGFLTCEYIAGRRYRYVPPLRLFLVTSLVCIFFIWLLNLTGAEQLIGVQSKSDVVESRAAGEDPQAGEEVREGEDVIDEGISLNVSWLSPENNRQLEARLHRNVERIRNDPNDFLGDVLQLVPRSMLLLVPLFAFVMRLAYPFAGRYYVEHLVHAVHCHAFLFLGILLQVGLQSGASAASQGDLGALASVLGTLEAALMLWLFLYFLFSLKRVYGQGWALTIWKWIVLSLAYYIMAALALLSIILLSVLLA